MFAIEKASFNSRLFKYWPHFACREFVRPEIIEGKGKHVKTKYKTTKKPNKDKKPNNSEKPNRVKQLYDEMQANKTTTSWPHDKPGKRGNAKVGKFKSRPRIVGRQFDRI